LKYNRENAVSDSIIQNVTVENQMSKLFISTSKRLFMFLSALLSISQSFVLTIHCFHLEYR